MLSHLKKSNSPSYIIHDKYNNHITRTIDHNHMISPSNVINPPPNRKSIRASSSTIPNQQTISPQENLSQSSIYSNEYLQSTHYPDMTLQSLISREIDLSNHEISICHTLSGLTSRQRYICAQHTGLVWAMLEGTHLSMLECVHQFKHEQWNCSAVNLLYRVNTKSTTLSSIHGLEGILQRGSRETAFLSSSWSAGVVQAITRACSRGQMGTCDCDPRRREGQGRDAEGIFTWGGCSDPIRFGMRLARLFLDANDEEHRNAAVRREQELQEQKMQLLSSMKFSSQDKQNPRKRHRTYRFSRSISNSTSDQNFKSDILKKVETSVKQENQSKTILSPREIQAETLQIIQTKARTLMNLHNKKAGRRLIWKNRVTQCKCHGVSGACSMRTCWQRVNEFRLIGMLLKSAYNSAIHVTYEPRLDILKRINTKLNSNNYMPRRNHPLVSSNYNTNSKNWLVFVKNQTNHNRKHYLNDFLYNEQVHRRWPRMTMMKSRDIPNNQLVYLEESPNYCYFDETIGHLGIAGRQCNATSNDAVNSCSRLCCDRGYDTLEFEREQKCECKFFWCCEVRCNLCRERTVLHHCKH
ncbi:unnamed protein product [Schistosoma turkestanicum]|nr:unnamed protein product [Schistosoma turkestanicum]